MRLGGGGKSVGKGLVEPGSEDREDGGTLPRLMALTFPLTWTTEFLHWKMFTIWLISVFSITISLFSSWFSCQGRSTGAVSNQLPGSLSQWKEREGRSRSWGRIAGKWAGGDGNAYDHPFRSVQYRPGRFLFLERRRFWRFRRTFHTCFPKTHPTERKRSSARAPGYDGIDTIRRGKRKGVRLHLKKGLSH